MSGLRDTEWTFAANAASWINEILSRQSDLPFSEAKVEQSAKGKRTRRDLAVYRKGGGSKPVISGEIKLPENPEGKSPYHTALVDSAHEKADELGVDYFFTWNVNQFVLWRTYQSGVPMYERDMEAFDVVSLKTSDDINKPHIVERIKKFLGEFLSYFTGILAGTQKIRTKPLDERFISIIESALADPIYHTQHIVAERYYKKTAFRQSLRKWMVVDQGWSVTNDTVDEHLDRAAKLSCFVTANKLIFYNVLRKRFPLTPLALANPDATIRELKDYCKDRFDEAIRETKDYKTVFIEDQGNRLAFLSDDAAPGWREFIRQINSFDLTQLNYDVIGPIFERLLSPAERHRFGQHYTSPDVVDLINTACIKNTHDVVLDPACGGGTFLVRAYALKKDMSEGKLAHHEILTELFGVDISRFATDLSTINLASRDLVHAANYPRVHRSDFFDVQEGTTKLLLPGGNGGDEMETVAFPKFDVIVGNPPYIKQELITDKARIIAAVQQSMNGRKADFSRRSDIHVYFWPYAGKLLKDGGRLGFLASSSWPDVEYGYKLQRYLLEHFKVLSVFESLVEPWFSVARVATCATVIQKEADPKARDENIVRFVQLRQKISDIIDVSDDDEKRFEAYTKLHEQIASLTESYADAAIRVRVIKQSDLYELGCRIALDARADDDDDGETDGPEASDVETATQRKYFGSKWGIYLRAPDFFFELRETFAESLRPLADVADVKYGLKTGADDFFYVEDITDSDEIQELTPKQLQDKFGVEKRQLKSRRIVRNTAGHDAVMEQRFLKPVFMSIMGFEELVVEPQHINKWLFTTNQSPTDLQGTFAARYIRYGERTGFHEKTFIKNRTKKTGYWYDVGSYTIGDVFWPKAHQYRHAAPANPNGYICNNRVYAITAYEDAQGPLLAAVLNTTFSALMKEYYGRILGREGNTDTMVGDCKQMITLKLDAVGEKAAARLVKAHAAICTRKTLPFCPMGDELEQKDRQELDEAFFECLGIKTNKKQNEYRERLYEVMTSLYRAKRSLELVAIENKRRSSHGGEPTADDIAEEIWDEFDATKRSLFPEDFLGVAELGKTERIDFGTGQRHVVGEGLFASHEGLEKPGPEHVKQGTILFDTREFDLKSIDRARYAAMCLSEGQSGVIEIPKDSEVCRTLTKAHADYLANLNSEFKKQAEERTSSTKELNKVLQLIANKIRATTMGQREGII